jgi:nitroimidazol reductase NimA-like FMN-containing flavoprotein (pyridoxamine 5'-phosphate oxidase superfamily)
MQITAGSDRRRKNMFREMMRSKQQLSQEECVTVLKEEPRGVLSVLGDDDYPYGMPINQYYCEEDGRLYFHSGMKGHKIDAMKRHDKASFCVYDSGFRREGEWALNIKSVIVFGRIEIIEDRDKIYEIARKLSYKFTDDEAYIEREIKHAGPRTLMFALVPEYMTGKIVNEA